MMLMLTICDADGNSYRSLASFLLAPLETRNKLEPGTLRHRQDQTFNKSQGGYRHPFLPVCRQPRTPGAPLSGHAWHCGR